MGGTSSRGARRVAAGLFVVALAAGCSSSGGDRSGAEPAPPATEAPTTTTTKPPRPMPDGYAGFKSETYTDPAHWLCRPDKDDVCDKGLDATVVAADGTLTPEPYKAATDPPVDCFYVYPTISRDPTPNSDLNASDTEEGTAALSQVARLGTHCRVFAPTYRQVTLTALSAAIQGKTMPGVDYGLGYRDVVDAWKHYVANDNHGRGVVLVGHSQGSGLLTQLIKNEIDPKADVRALLVAAYLPGSNLNVPDGADVGGDFKNVPLCRKPDQTGCALAWASFRADPGPPENTRFGRVRAQGSVAACVNPAALTGGKAPLHSYFSRRPGGAAAAVGQSGGRAPANWVDPAKGEITTNFVSTPGLVEGECTQHDGFSYLAVSVKADPADPRADDIGGDLTPDWGLHLIDVGLVMGDMVDLVGRQAQAYVSG